MTSWKTTLGGALGALGTFLWGAPVALKAMDVPVEPTLVKWCVIAGLVASAGGVFFIGLFGRDNNVTSEDVKAAKDAAAEKRSNGGVSLLALLMLGLATVALALLPVLLFTGCGTLPKTVITVTSIVDEASKEWATAKLDGRTTAKLDQDFYAAHALYREAAGKAALVYEAAVNNGDAAGRVAALKAIKEAAEIVLDILLPVSPQAVNMKESLAKAQAP